MIFQFAESLGRFDSLVELNQRDDKRGLLVALRSNLKVLDEITRQANATIDRYSTTITELRYYASVLEDMIDHEASGRDHWQDARDRASKWAGTLNGQDHPLKGVYEYIRYLEAGNAERRN